jgi:hypothetical protein
MQTLWRKKREQTLAMATRIGLTLENSKTAAFLGAPTAADFTINNGIAHD